MKLLIVLFLKMMFLINFTLSVKLSKEDGHNQGLAHNFFHFKSTEDSSSNSKIINKNKFYEVSSATGTIFLAGFGDKSFLITTVLATKYSKLTVFISASSSLVLMGYVSVQMGLILPDLVPTCWIDIIAVLIFLVLGTKILVDGLKMKSQSSLDMLNEVQREINKEILKENELLAEIKRQESEEKQENSAIKETLETFVQTFTLIFLSELGDKSQISTIYLSSNSDPLLIFYSVCFAQILLTIIAVLGGHFVSGRVSEKTLTVVAGIMFLAFGIISLYLTYINDYVIINKAWNSLLKYEHKQNMLNHIPDRKVVMNSFLQF